MTEDEKLMEIGDIVFFRNENGIIKHAIKRILSSKEFPEKPEYNMAARILIDDKSEEEVKEELLKILDS